MKSKLKETIQKELDKYQTKEILIDGKTYALYVVPEYCDEHIALFEGFLFAEVKNKSKFAYFKTQYKTSAGGYTPRIGIIIYEELLLIKDFRKNKYILKTINKINNLFLKKLKNSIKEPSEDSFKDLFDRTDVIEEFYILYKNSREFLLKNVLGISEEEKRKEFVDNFMMQMLTLWYLQERGFFNKDAKYFITKFNELTQKKLFNEFKNYYDFLNYLFDKMSNEESKQYIEDQNIGKIVVIGPAAFLNGEEYSEAVSIPDECFYKNGLTDKLISQDPKKISFDIPLLNLFESRDWTEGNIDEFVLGAIYEKLITGEERKKQGAYYTPEEITSYICKNSIEQFLVDQMKEKFNTNYKSIDDIVDFGDEEVLVELFEHLKEIKILDPAVGSGHFLESAINVLVNIYEKIWNKAKDLNIKKGLNIVSTDEKGKIITINLLEIQGEDKFKLLVKFFIILSKNIYGVDINPTAIKVAKARMFLTLAKHFRIEKENGIFIRFPNVHFNLREGNSLIGYVDFNKEEKKKGNPQLVLFDINLQESQRKYISEEIELMSDLQDYLEKTTKFLSINGNLIQEIKNLNKILSKDKINLEDFKNVLKVKEKLTTILIVSLNSEYAIPLNNLLREITNLFNQKLDEIFAKEYKVTPQKLKEIKTFHWIFEFPEVFLKKAGFDVVIGNPPYIRQEEINNITKGVKYKYILSKIFVPFDNTFDISLFFVLRSLQLVRKDGYHSFIITNKWLRTKYGEKIRKFLKENCEIKKIIDFNGVKVFMGANVDTLVYIIRKAKPNKENLIFYNHALSIDEIEKGGYYVKQDNLKDNIWNFVNKDAEEIEKWVEKVGKPLKSLEILIYRGITTGFNDAFIINDEIKKNLIEEDSKSSELIKPVLRGANIGRYYLEWDKKWIIAIPKGLTKKLSNGQMLPIDEAEEIFKNNYPSIYSHLSKFKNLKTSGKGLLKRDDQGDYWWELRACDYYPEFEKPKVVWQRVNKYPAFTYENTKMLTLDSTVFMTDKNLKVLNLILLSKLSENYYIKNYVHQLGGKGYLLSNQYISKFPIVIPKNPKIYEAIVDYLLFLNAIEERRTEFKNIINFFDRQIADSLVYELYFKEKFAEEGLYPQPKERLLNEVYKYLKPINYDRWSELYWKNQFEEQLTTDEKIELQNLEKENLKAIIETYEKISKDEKIDGLIKKIKSHDWVKIIEEGST